MINLKTWPETIYLQVSDDLRQDELPTFDEYQSGSNEFVFEEASWCEESISTCGVAYTRKDLYDEVFATYSDFIKKDKWELSRAIENNAILTNENGYFREQVKRLDNYLEQIEALEIDGVILRGILKKWRHQRD